VGEAPGRQSEAAFEALHSGKIRVLGGTAWLWSRPEFAKSVDVLFVDCIVVKLQDGASVGLGLIYFMPKSQVVPTELRRRLYHGMRITLCPVAITPTRLPCATRAQIICVWHRPFLQSKGLLELERRSLACAKNKAFGA
jgi:hypothetical protein